MVGNVTLYESLLSTGFLDGLFGEGGPSVWAGRSRNSFDRAGRRVSALLTGSGSQSVNTDCLNGYARRMLTQWIAAGSGINHWRIGAGVVPATSRCVSEARLI